MGGPSGRLSSTIIQSSCQKIVGIVDETGLCYDPEGLDKQELLRMCSSNLTIDGYSSSLSATGYKVCKNDTNVKLPDGSHVDGSHISNEFYL